MYSQCWRTPSRSSSWHRLLETSPLRVLPLSQLPAGGAFDRVKLLSFFRPHSAMLARFCFLLILSEGIFDYVESAKWRVFIGTVTGLVRGRFKLRDLALNE